VRAVARCKHFWRDPAIGIHVRNAVSLHVTVSIQLKTLLHACVESCGKGFDHG